jgi:hypothetical protein
MNQLDSWNCRRAWSCVNHDELSQSPPYALTQAPYPGPSPQTSKVSQNSVTNWSAVWVPLQRGCCFVTQLGQRIPKRMWSVGRCTSHIPCRRKQRSHIDTCHCCSTQLVPHTLPTIASVHAQIRGADCLGCACVRPQQLTAFSHKTRRKKLSCRLSGLWALCSRLTTGSSRRHNDPLGNVPKLAADSSDQI